MDFEFLSEMAEELVLEESYQEVLRATRDVLLIAKAVVDGEDSVDSLGDAIANLEEITDA